MAIGDWRSERKHKLLKKRLDEDYYKDIMRKANLFEAENELAIATDLKKRFPDNPDDIAYQRKSKPKKSKSKRCKCK